MRASRAFSYFSSRRLGGSGEIFAQRAKISPDYIMDLFGPLPQQYCLYFYFLSVIGYVLMILALGFGIFSYFSNKKFVGFGQLFMIVAGYFIIYFQNRLLYSMCYPTLKREGFELPKAKKDSNSDASGSDLSNLSTMATSLFK